MSFDTKFCSTPVTLKSTEVILVREETLGKRQLDGVGVNVNTLSLSSKDDDDNDDDSDVLVVPLIVLNLQYRSAGF